MTVSTQAGTFGFGPQSAKGTLPATWYRHRAARVQVGTQQEVVPFPPEVGGGFHTSGVYKSMAFGVGNITLNPRFEGVIGWMLHGLIGQECAVYADTPESGVYRHVFTPPDQPNEMQWLGLREYVPGSASGDEMGEAVKDARMVSGQFAFPAGALATATLAAVGREPFKMQEMDAGDSYEWAWGNAMEDFDSVPVL